MVGRFLGTRAWKPGNGPGNPVGPAAPGIKDYAALFMDPGLRLGNNSAMMFDRDSFWRCET